MTESTTPAPEAALSDTEVLEQFAEVPERGQRAITCLRPPRMTQGRPVTGCHEIDAGDCGLAHALAPIKPVVNQIRTSCIGNARHTQPAPKSSVHSLSGIPNN